MKTRPSPSRRKRAAQAPAAAARAPTYEDLTQIVELLRSTSQFSEFRLRSGDIELEVRRANGATRTEVRYTEKVAAPQAAQAPAKQQAESLPPGLTLVRAPMVGTFYCAPGPGEPPFVQPGSRVAAETTVCIIEVMKLMNSIAAGCAGVVTHVLVDNAALVEYGQPLIAIDPEA